MDDGKAVNIAHMRNSQGRVRSIQTPAGFYVAAALRLALGIALFVAAPRSRVPDVISILGVLIVVAGLAAPFFGLERFRKLLDWWSNRGSLTIRLWCGIACGFWCLARLHCCRLAVALP